MFGPQAREHLSRLNLCLGNLCGISRSSANLTVHVPDLNCKLACAQAVQGVPKVEKGINPATWMLEVSSVGAESRTGINFTHVYADSKFAKYAPCCLCGSQNQCSRGCRPS